MESAIVLITATPKLLLQDTPTSSDPFTNFATAEIKASLVQKYKSSKYARKAKTRIAEVTTTVRLPKFYLTRTSGVTNFTGNSTRTASEKFLLTETNPNMLKPKPDRITFLGHSMKQLTDIAGSARS